MAAGWFAAGVALAATLALAPLGSAAWRLDPKDDKAAKPEKTDKAPAVKMLDVVVFRNGNQVEGEVLEETETSIRMKVTVYGITSETTYAKSEILEIKKNAKKAPVVKKTEDAMSDSGKEGSDAGKGADAGLIGGAADGDARKVVDKDGKAIPADTLKVYVVPMVGEFGREFSFRSADRVLADIELAQPDVVLFKFDFEFGVHGEKYADFQQKGAEQAFNQLEQAREIGTVIFDRLKSSKFKTQPRIAAWVKKSLGGAAFLPCAFPEIYFTSDGLQGGLGGLDLLFKGVGDEVAQEKQRSLRLARMKGMAELGKHDTRIVEAMTRGDFWLSYKLEGGKPVFRTEKPDSPDWILLKDDGEGVNADRGQDIIRMKGNDYLTMDAKTAQNIGWSRGTADTVDDLLFQMQITRNFAVIKDRASPILKAWSAEVKQQEDNLSKIFAKLRRVRVREPGGAREQNAAWGQQIQILKEALPIVNKYKVEINPELLGAPQEIKNGIERRITELELMIRNNKPIP